MHMRIYLQFCNLVVGSCYAAHSSLQRHEDIHHPSIRPSEASSTVIRIIEKDRFLFFPLSLPLSGYPRPRRITQQIAPDLRAGSPAPATERIMRA